MSRKAELSPTGDRRLAVSGDLTLDTVTALYRKSLGFAEKKRLPEIIDLAGVKEIDSSGLALLLEWQSWALAHEHCFEFTNAPAHLLQLASLSETRELLELKDCENSQAL